MRLELDSRLRAFAAIARQHSFSKAADELFISQPAVSRHVAELEKQLGVQLVTRSTQGAALTPAGEYLLPPILSVFEQANPGVTVDLILGTSSLVIDAVRTHRAELGVVGGLAAREEVEVEPLCKDEIVLVGPPSLAGKPLTPRRLRTFSQTTPPEPGGRKRPPH